MQKSQLWQCLQLNMANTRTRACHLPPMKYVILYRAVVRIVMPLDWKSVCTHWTRRDDNAAWRPLVSKNKSSDPSSELEVLKSILLREGYLERLHHLARRRGDQTALRGEVVDVLDLIRMSTVETIETILKWKRTLVKPYPFVWNGVNYH